MILERIIPTPLVGGVTKLTPLLNHYQELYHSPPRAYTLLWLFAYSALSFFDGLLSGKLDFFLFQVSVREPEEFLSHSSREADFGQAERQELSVSQQLWVRNFKRRI